MDDGQKGSGSSWQAPHFDPKTLRMIGAVSHVAGFSFVMLGCIAAGMGIGYFLDKWFATRPWMMLVMLFVGVLAGFWTVYRMIMDEAQKHGGPADPAVIEQAKKIRRDDGIYD